MKEIELLKEELADYRRFLRELVRSAFYLSGDNEILASRKEDYDYRELFSTELIIMVTAILEDKTEEETNQK